MSINKRRDNVGFKTDYVGVPFAAGVNSVLAYAVTGYFHVHGKALVYPNHADEITLTAGAGAWNLTGLITEIVPENALNESAFDLHWINISGISANGTIQIDLYAGNAGEEVLIWSGRATRTTVTSPNGSHPLHIPQQPAGTRISARLSDSTAGALTCQASVEGHYYKAG